MEEETTVIAENTAPESAPETTPAETVETTPETPAESTETVETKPAEERTSRADERIRDIISQRKAAEAKAEAVSREADYWKAQALANQPAETDELEGVTEEGIDPVKFAQSLKAQILRDIQKEQGLSAAQQKILAEQVEVSNQPEMKDDFFRDYAVNYAKANNVSPWEAYAEAKERFEELGKRANTSSKVRNSAGQFVREETATPPTGRGTSSSETYFTREQVDKMDLTEYAKNAQEIHRQMSRGLIK